MNTMHQPGFEVEYISMSTTSPQRQTDPSDSIEGTQEAADQPLKLLQRVCTGFKIN
jgi:hypothetical protein